ncbi:MAG: hypothetical protein VKM01_09305 [Cyanobacteriota bacterium]|nr:hypothetical protein [Cyanobacteriota bacterium]
MKESPLPADRSDHHGPAGVVLVGLASGAASGPGSLPPLSSVTRRLAEVLGRPVLKLATVADPDAALSAIGGEAGAGRGGWLAGLEIDVGLPLADGRCWGEALGAWRQPALLVIPSHQLHSGGPAAATALLRQWQVPLLGLMQWDGAWQPEERLRDGLPWLGLLAPDDQRDTALGCDGERALAAALALRWSQLDQP